MDARIEMRRGRYTPVVMSHDDWPWPEVLVATDVNPWGMFIATEHTLDPGEEVRLSFRLGTPELWELEGQVVRSKQLRRQVDLGFSGIGLWLTSPSASERRHMRKLLRGVPPPIPSASLWEGTDAGSDPGRRRPARRGGRRREDRPLRRWSWIRRASA